jgi:UDP-N-acetylmuramoyl-tripeptide--D-alanyl-D-alanine ligase
MDPADRRFHGHAIDLEHTESIRANLPSLGSDVGILLQPGDDQPPCLSSCSFNDLRLRGAVETTGITTDTRKIAKGNVFVALRGERFDGHDYLTDAVRDGASAVVVSKAPKLNALGVPVFEVRDTLVALGASNARERRAWGKPVIGVAGSNGKTSTKDLLRAVLSRDYAVHATTGNLNNRIGVPLSLLSIPPEAEIAVIELGTSLPGEVAILRDIAEPNIALVTSIAEEHLEGLGDLAGVLREEAAVYEGIEVGIAPSAQPEIVEAARGKARRLDRRHKERLPRPHERSARSSSGCRRDRGKCRDDRLRCWLPLRRSAIASKRIGRIHPLPRRTSHRLRSEDFRSILLLCRRRFPSDVARPQRVQLSS